MSLTSLLNKKDIKEKFKKEFYIPKLEVKFPLLAPPISKRYSLVGTAFDYLLRFYLKHKNYSHATTYTWVAEDSVVPFSPLIQNIEIDACSDTVIYTETPEFKIAKKIIASAKDRYTVYLRTGVFTSQIFESALQLSQLDLICRTNIVSENLGEVHRDDIEDLRNLVLLIKPELFKFSHTCLLNPSFGSASRSVGGADADILVDDTLIDVKTTKNFQLKRDYINQLMGYVILNEISSIGELKPRPEITKIAIYYSRHAYFHVISLDEIIGKESFLELVNWFSRRVKKENRKF